MKPGKWWWLGLVGLLALPYLTLLVFGSIWLYERGWLWAYMAMGAAVSTAAWAIARWRKQQRLVTPESSAGPNPNWPPLGEQAWEQVEAIARRVEQENPAIDNMEGLWRLLQDVLETVARHYHPKSKRAVLEVRVPDLLFIVELVSRDLRELFSTHVPGAHIWTLHDLQSLPKWNRWYQNSYQLYRVGHVLANPIGAMIRELRDFVAGKLVTASGEEIRAWALGFCVRQAGRYAIDLYSGQLVIDEEKFRSFRSAQTTADLARGEQLAVQTTGEPLRLLVIGQVKSGKSSLINALFGQTRAAVDVVPQTASTSAYVLEREEVPHAIILDTAGYDDPRQTRAAFAQLRESLLACDLVLLVTSATNAAREADRRLLDELRAFFLAEPTRRMPPVIVVLSQIDRVRPIAEWSPPYDLTHPQGMKAEQIVLAVETVAEDLELSPDRVVPVCLLPERQYNVEECLIPAIAESLQAANRVKYLRCLREFHDEEYWRRLWQQAINSGRLLVAKGKELLSKKSM